MPIYLTPCQDGSDRYCHQTVENDIPLLGLTDDQIEEIAESNGAFVSLDQLINQPDELTDPSLLINQENLIHFPFTLNRPICSACGSDQTYDEEGNNITGA